MRHWQLHYQLRMSWSFDRAAQQAHRRYRSWCKRAGFIRLRPARQPHASAKAMNGDIAAAKEIGDRLDGKASQAIEHSGSLSIAGQFALLRQREAKAVQRGEAKAEERFDRRLVQRGGI